MASNFFCDEGTRTGGEPGTLSGKGSVDDVVDDDVVVVVKEGVERSIRLRCEFVVVRCWQERSGRSLQKSSNPDDFTEKSPPNPPPRTARLLRLLTDGILPCSVTAVLESSTGAKHRIALATREHNLLVFRRPVEASLAEMKEEADHVDWGLRVASNLFRVSSSPNPPRLHRWWRRLEPPPPDPQ